MHNITLEGVRKMNYKQYRTMSDLIDILYSTPSHCWEHPSNIEDLAMLIMHRCKGKISSNDAMKVSDAWFSLQRNLSPAQWEVELHTTYHTFIDRAKLKYELTRECERRSNNICLIGKPIDFFYNEEIDEVNDTRLIAVIERHEINEVEYYPPPINPYADGRRLYSIRDFDRDGDCYRRHLAIHYTLIIYAGVEEEFYDVFQGEGI